KNAPDPVFVSDLEGKILQANDAVSALLGFRPDELLEQSLSRFISTEETREFTAVLREVVERGVTRNARLNPRSASGEVIPTTLNASAPRDPDGKVIGAIGILRDMRQYEQVVRDLEKSKSELQEKILDLEKFEEVVVGRELKMIALEKELESLRNKSKGRGSRAYNCDARDGDGGASGSGRGRRRGGDGRAPAPRPCGDAGEPAAAARRASPR